MGFGGKRFPHFRAFLIVMEIPNPMTWYYVKEGDAVGPITDQELRAMLRGELLAPTTLVWKQGMPEWQPASRMIPSMTVSSIATAPEFSSISKLASGVPIGSAPGIPPVLPHYFCTHCGMIIPADQLVRINERAVCGACKPTYVQHVREGLKTPFKTPVIGVSAGLSGNPQELGGAGLLPFAGFWIRGLAILIDVALFFFLGTAIGMASGMTFREAAGIDGDDWTTRDSLLLGMDLILGTIYDTVLVAKYGGTLGKLVCRIRVVTADGQRLSYHAALGRSLASWLSFLTCGLGYVFAAFDKQKRTVHDLICHTRVIWKKTS